MTEWERHPVFADFVARVLEQVCDFAEGTLVYHTRMHTLRAGDWDPAQPRVIYVPGL